MKISLRPILHCYLSLSSWFYQCLPVFSISFHLLSSSQSFPLVLFQRKDFYQQQSHCRASSSVLITCLMLRHNTRHSQLQGEREFWGSWFIEVSAHSWLNPRQEQHSGRKATHITVASKQTEQGGVWGGDELLRVMPPRIHLFPQQAPPPDTIFRCGFS